LNPQNKIQRKKKENHQGIFNFHTKTILSTIPKETNMKASEDNNALIEGAGKVHLDKPQMWGRGIVDDFKRTVGSHWVEEVTNFNQKTIAVTLLLFISVIAPTLTFGAVYGKATGNHIGAVETILGTSWVGIAYSLIGGMPMVSFFLLLRPAVKRAFIANQHN
jgi:hypothetical protein